MTIDLTSFGTRPESSNTPKEKPESKQEPQLEEADLLDPSLDEVRRIEKTHTPVFKKFHWQIDKFTHSKEDFLYKAPEGE